MSGMHFKWLWLLENLWPRFFLKMDLLIKNAILYAYLYIYINHKNCLGHTLITKLL